MNYRVIYLIRNQKHGCYEHVLALLRVQRASMSPQDWAQITFRSEMHLNDFNNESGSQLEKREKSGSGDLSTIYRESQTWFLCLYWILTTIDLNTCIHIRFLLSNNLEGHKLKSQVVCSGWLKQKLILGLSVYCAQITRSWFFFFF